MKIIKLDDFLLELKAQGVPRKHLAFRCPICQTIQSMASLMAAGAGDSEEAVEKYLGFSCVGRFTGAGPFIPEASLEMVAIGHWEVFFIPGEKIEMNVWIETMMLSDYEELIAKTA